MSRRQEILGVARDLFLSEGLDGITLREVAARVKISAPAIYKHFESKDALLREVVDMGRERFAAYLVRGLRGATPAERLQLTGEGYLDFAFEQPRDYQVMFMAWDQLKLGVHAPASGKPTPMFQFLLDRVRESLPTPRAADAADVFETALLFWAECHGLASLYLSGGGLQAMPLEHYRGLARRIVERLMRSALT
jgi:AcrR family transcriptional regulator